MQQLNTHTKVAASLPRSWPHAQKDDDCTRAEFSLAMLHKLNKVDEKDINMCFQQFKKLDRHEDGRLDAADLDAALSELAKEEGEVVQVDA